VPSNSDLGLLTDFPGLPATDLVILAHCQPETADTDTIARVEERIKERNPDLPIVRSLFEPEILGDQEELAKKLAGKRAYCLTTAPEIVKDRLSDAMERDYKCKMLGVSCHLSRDDLMRKDIQAVLASPEPPEAFFIEIKARGVEAARLISETSGLPYYYINNVPKQVDRKGNLVPGNPDLDREIHRVLTAGAERFNKRRGTDFPTG
jgi:predicted GTPase